MMTNKQYHSALGISASGLKLFAQAPAKYWQEYLNTDRPERESTPAQQFGTAWHAALFEPEKFAADYVQIPEGLDRRTKEGKALFADMTAGGRIPMGFDDYLAIEAMINRIVYHPEWQSLEQLPGWLAEWSIFHKDAETGCLLKIRPDYHLAPCVHAPNGIIIDGKTCADASPEAFGRDAFKYGYWLQAAVYCDVFQAFHGTEDRPEFILFAQEKSAPYLVKPYRVTDDQIAYGRSLYRPLLPQVVQCLETGIWPGYGDKIEDLQTPGYAARLMDENGEVEISYE